MTVPGARFMGNHPLIETVVPTDRLYMMLSVPSAAQPVKYLLCLTAVKRYFAVSVLVK